MLPSLSSFSLFLVVTTILLVRGVVIRPYNYVSYTVFDTFAELAATYLHHEDDEHFTNTNLFLGVADPECWDKLQSPAFLGAQRHGGGNVSAVSSNKYYIVYRTKLFLKIRFLSLYVTIYNIHI